MRARSAFGFVQLFQFAVRLLRNCMYYYSKYFAAFNTKLTIRTQTSAFLHAALHGWI